MTFNFDAMLAEVKTDVLRWRRYIHAHPELSFQEHKTAAYIAQQLESFGGLTLTHLTPNSIIADLKGAHSGPMYALRADIDALPIQEENDEPFCSTVPGVMHACGHDAHTAMLLGAAKVLTQCQSALHGSVRFIFQHAEELPPGGAQELVDLGVLDGVEKIFGLHVMPNSPTGEVGLKEGVFCASTDNFDITITGKGGHGSMPQLCIDPIVIGAEVVTALQNVVARRIDPLQVPVLTIATFQTGESYNVIPERVKLAGTLRTHHSSVREQVPQLMEQIISGITAAHGAQYELRWTRGYVSGDNHPDACAIARQVIEKTLGPLALREVTEPLFGGEDFSSYQQKVPGCFLFIGCRNEKIGAIYGVHNPRFRLDEEALQTGVALHVGFIRQLLMNDA